MLLEVNDLSVAFETPRGSARVLRHAEFSLDQGETLGIVGESGCGKSTAALALMDLLPPTAKRSGERILFEGQDLLKVGPRRMNALRGNRMSMIFQEPMTSLNPSYTIGNQLVEVLLRHGRVGREAARKRAIELLERTGIEDAPRRLRQFPHQLSGGLRQRVMIAMGLMCSPSLLIADEPTTALDVTVQLQILALIKELMRELRMGLILITHDVGVVAHMADHVLIMYAGQIVERGPVDRVLRDPQHPYTRGLLACVPQRGQRGKPLEVIEGSVVASLAEDGCPFRNRCKSAMPVCGTGPIPTFERSKDHRYTCRLEPTAG